MSEIPAVFASIGTVFKLIDFCAKLIDVPLENKNFCELIRIVWNDLQECSRLLQLERVKQQLEGDPDRKAYVHRTIDSVKLALNDIGAYVESVSRDEERKKGHTALVHRFQWVLGHQAKLESREKKLSTAHTSLMYVMHTLHIPESQGTLLPSYDEAVQGGTGETIISPDERWRRRRSEKERNDVDLIDLEEQPGEISKQNNRHESFDSCKPIPILDGASGLIDDPIQFKSSIISVSEIFNPPPTILNPVATQTKTTTRTSDTPLQSPTLSLWSTQTSVSELSASSPNASHPREAELPHEVVVPIQREISAGSVGAEERRRRRAKQNLFFGD